MHRETDVIVSDLNIALLARGFKNGVHIVAGPNNLCLCGMNASRPTTCEDILKTTINNYLDSKDVNDDF